MSVIKSLHMPSAMNKPSWSGMSAALLLRMRDFLPRVIYIDVDGEMVFHLISDIRQANHPCKVCCPKREKCPTV